MGQQLYLNSSLDAVDLCCLVLCNRTELYIGAASYVFCSKTEPDVFDSGEA